MTTAIDQWVDMHTPRLTNLINEAFGEIGMSDLPVDDIQDNEWNGADIWLIGQTGIKKDYLAQGVRVALDDTTIIVTKYVGNGLIDSQIKINNLPNSTLLATIVRGMLEA